ncbi:MAG TPA: outer membrane beta-barrel domain-containing protein [Myxococcota bacterium]
MLRFVPRFVPGLASTARLALAVTALSTVLSSPSLAQDMSLDDLNEAPAAEEPAAEPAEEPVESPSVEPTPVETPSSSSPATDPNKSATDEGIDLTLQDRIKAVSRKTFLKTGRFELTPSAMMTVNDPFYRTFAVGGRVAWHLNEAFALEIGGSYVPPFFIQELEPVDLVREELTLINADNDVVGMADVGVTFSPLYGKVALLGDSIIHFDGFISSGIGATFDNGADLLHPTMNIGVGGRVFLNRWLVVRVDVKDYIYPQEKNAVSTLQNLLFVGVGLGFYFPLDFDYQYEAARVNKNG